MSNKLTLYMFFMMISILPAILLTASTPWFLSQEAFPDPITITLQTKATFCMAFISLLATVFNFVIAVKMEEK